MFVIQTLYIFTKFFYKYVLYIYIVNVYIYILYILNIVNDVLIGPMYTIDYLILGSFQAEIIHMLYSITYTIAVAYITVYCVSRSVCMVIHPSLTAHTHTHTHTHTQLSINFYLFLYSSLFQFVPLHLLIIINYCMFILWQHYNTLLSTYI